MTNAYEKEEEVKQEDQEEEQGEEGEEEQGEEEEEANWWENIKQQDGEVHKIMFSVND